ncbi:MAG: hypothetical protein WCA09_00475 [Burkholderiales bacterium]
MLPPHAPNSLLAALPRSGYLRLPTKLKPVVLTFGEVLYEPGETIRLVFFLGTSLLSLLTLADCHLALEVGLIGRDGKVGVSANGGARPVDFA